MITTVKEAALFLDEKEPNWFKSISKQRLDLVDNFNCILGQIYGSYIVGSEKLALRIILESRYRIDIFCNNRNRTEWLTEIDNRLRHWIAQIEKRRQKESL